MTRRRWLWLGGGLFLALLLVRAPAALVSLFLPGASATLEGTEGTLWDGRGELWLRQQSAGTLSWQLLPAALTDGELGVRVALQGDGIDVGAEAFAGLGERRIEALAGRIDEAALLRLLRPYDLAIRGGLRLEGVGVRERASGFAEPTGVAYWDGGLLSYRLRGQRYDARLPPLAGKLGVDAGALRLAARQSPERAPLLTLRLRHDGWFKASASRAFVELAGQPWHGRAAPDEVVLEVEEELF